MMVQSSVSSIKRAQKERLLFREISQLFLRLTLDETRINDLSITRVGLSPDKGVCTVYFYTPQGLPHFENMLEILKLYKGSLRKAIGQKIASRYTPEIHFAFDAKFEKQEQLELLLEKVKKETLS
jgi:ribosome-binding factor A